MNPPKNFYFNKLLKAAEGVCKQHDIVLNFDGYDDLIAKLQNFNFNNSSEAWEIAKECNAWCEYIGDIKAVIKQELANAETDKKAIISKVSTEKDPSKVANGERLANSCEDVVAIRKQRNTFEALYEMLDDKLQFLIQSHYFARATCEWSNKCSTQENR